MFDAKSKTKVDTQILNELESLEFRIGFGGIVKYLADLAAKCRHDTSSNDPETANEYDEIRKIMLKTGSDLEKI